MNLVVTTGPLTIEILQYFRNKLILLTAQGNENLNKI